MQKRMVLVIAAAAVLGLAATVLGFVASKKSKALVSFDGQRCVYRRTPALGCGVAGALLAVTGVAVATAAGECLGRDDAPATGRRRAVAVARSKKAWAAVAMAAVMFLYGAAMKRGFSHWHGRFHDHACTELKSAVFAVASILSVVATGYAIGAYVYFQRTDEPAPGQFVAMGQTQWAQPYPPPPMANPAPPQYGHGGYGPRGQPAGTA